MGDAGSTFLGLFLGVRAVDGGLVEDAVPATVAVPVCLLAVPWYDLSSVVLLRLSQGRSPFHADKQHLSHRLVALGLSPPFAVGTICYLALGIGMGGVAIRQLNAESYWLWVYLAGCWIALAAFDYLTRKKRQTK